MKYWSENPLYKKLNFTIYTSNRPVNFLKQTVEALNVEGILPNIQHGSKLDDNWSGIPLSDLGLIKRLEEVNEPDFGHRSVYYKANRNLARAFLMPDDNTVEQTDKDILILEDDVVPCKDLQQEIQIIYRLIEESGLTKYVIALYSNYEWGTGPQALMRYKSESFYGLQATIFSGNIRSQCHSYHYKLCNELTTDFITKRIVDEGREITLLASRYSLFQHIGITTSGLGGNFHRTPNFLGQK